MSRKTWSHFKPYRVSIFATACVGLGFWTAYIDGATPDAVVKSALVFATVMVVFFAVGTLWQLSQQKSENDKQNR